MTISTDQLDSMTAHVASHSDPHRFFASIDLAPVETQAMVNGLVDRDTDLELGTEVEGLLSRSPNKLRVAFRPRAGLRSR